MALPVRGIALSLLAAASLCAGPEASAQFVPSPTSEARASAARALPRTSVAPGGDMALSGPVDPATYLVGPGDVFSVSIGGSLSSQTTTTVTADGLLVVPEAGTFLAAGRTLAAVRAEARAALRRQYQNVPTDVALAAPRRFSVYVSGFVPLPGRHVVSALGRVEDALAEATGEATPLDLADYATPPRFDIERRAALRNVLVTDRDGTEARVDLLRYYATGDLAYNPLLADGASITLPTFDPTRESVTVSGAVDRPGYYDWRPGDTAAALVAVAAGADLGLRAAAVRRTRTAGGRTESVEVALHEAGSLSVEPRDQIFVVPATPEAGYATAVGAVAFPGAYPIRSGETTLQDFLDAAGGLTSDALARGAYLERSIRAEPQAALDPLASPTGRPITTAAFDSTVTPRGQLSDLGFAGRRYYVQEYATTPRLSLDLTSALSGGAPVVLRDGDRLVVPRDLGLIRVFGQVSEPGYVPFEPGLTAADYVERAGGLGPAATTLYTVDARTGRFTAGAETPVRAGDDVFVDRPPRSDSPELQGLALQEQNLALQDRGLSIQQENLELQRRREEREIASDRRQVLFQTVSLVIAAASTLVTAFLLSNRTN